MHLRQINKLSPQLVSENGQWEVEARTGETARELMRRNNALEPGGLVEVLITTVESLIDDEPCERDHHGNCQTHNLGKPCEVERARAVLAAYQSWKKDNGDWRKP